jgi:hypothetical protein
MDQRMVGLTFTASSGALTVTGPPNQNIAPPGYYLLFLLNSGGVPSIAIFVQVSQNPADQPPKGSITSPAANLTIGVNQSVTFSGTATDPDGTVAKQQWIFPEYVFSVIGRLVVKFLQVFIFCWLPANGVR